MNTDTILSVVYSGITIPHDYKLLSRIVNVLRVTTVPDTLSRWFRAALQRVFFNLFFLNLTIKKSGENWRQTWSAGSGDGEPYVGARVIARELDRPITIFRFSKIRVFFKYVFYDVILPLNALDRGRHLMKMVCGEPVLLRKRSETHHFLLPGVEAQPDRLPSLPPYPLRPVTCSLVGRALGAPDPLFCRRFGGHRWPGSLRGRTALLSHLLTEPCYEVRTRGGEIYWNYLQPRPANHWGKRWMVRLKEALRAS